MPGVELLYSGAIAAFDSSIISGAVCHMSVLMAPGSTSETGIPHGRSSTRSASPIASRANFDAV